MTAKKRPHSSPTHWLKRQAEIAAGLMASWALLSGLYVGIVKFSGGNIVPWATVVDVTRIVDGLRNADKCREYNSRLSRANDELQRNPENMYVQSVYRDALSEMDGIPDCKQIVFLRPVPV